MEQVKNNNVKKKRRRRLNKLGKMVVYGGSAGLALILSICLIVM